MPRSSDIVRAGMETKVEQMASSGANPGTIAAAISNRTGHDISTSSVRRHLAKQSLNAAIPSEDNAIKMLAAAISGMPDTRDSTVSSYYGMYQLNTTNNFTRYYGIARGIKNGQVLRAFKNIALKITNGARIVGDERDAEKIDALMTAINFSSFLQNVVRYTCEMGTCLVGLKADTGEYMVPSILPIQYYTLLTDQETAGTVDTDKLVHGEVTQIVFDEMDAKKVFSREDIGLLRLWEDGEEVQDISGRNTFGIYGESMTEGVETPLKSLLNGSYYYDAFIQEYGMGRYVHNMKTLAELVINKTVSPAAAKVAQDETAAAMQSIRPNENIVTVGDDIRMMESRTGFNIVPYFDWRAKQIDRALLQSDVGAGDVGSSWTSAGTAVSAQDYDTYNSLRETLFSQFMKDIIEPRLEEFNLNPKTISIAATPFLRVAVPFTDLITMCEIGNITERELRTRAGFDGDQAG